jgi:hypothetical protein
MISYIQLQILHEANYLHEISPELDCTIIVGDMKYTGAIQNTLLYTSLSAENYQKCSNSVYEILIKTFTACFLLLFIFPTNLLFLFVQRCCNELSTLTYSSLFLSLSICLSMSLMLFFVTMYNFSLYSIV